MEIAHWNAVYQLLTEHGFSKKPVLEGAGGAAGEAYAWAIANPDKVCCIYGENPILRCTMTKAQPLDNLGVLAKAGVPTLHVCGSLDPMLQTHTRAAEARCKELGAELTVLIQEGIGHYPTAPRDPTPVVDFILRQQEPKPAEPKSTPSQTHAKQATPQRADHQFDKTISRQVLEDYLARAITMERMLNGKGDLDDNIRMLKDIGAKFIGRALCLWAGEAGLLKNLERAKQQLPLVHRADPDMICKPAFSRS